jgi:hypothetical protein
MSQNMVSDTITHVTINTINGALIWEVDLKYTVLNPESP